MVEQQIIAYTEPKPGMMYRPYLSGETPTVYQPDTPFVEALNRGLHISEADAFARYFARIEAQDPAYMESLTRIVRGRAEGFPESVHSMGQRRLQFIVPAYREGENFPRFLDNMRCQFEQSDSSDWGVTFVIDYALPYAHGGENTAREEMHHQVARFLEQYPQYRSRIDWIYYVRPKDMRPPVLPVGLARKLGADVIMYERLQALKGRADSSVPSPLYLGLMDADTTELSDGLLDAMVKETRPDDRDKPRVIRVLGGFDSEEVRQHPHLLPFQMTWEGVLSELGRTTRHQPFNIGRLSAVPAREAAITGGGFARKLRLTDEDIRWGLEIAGRLDNIDVVEPEGHYATSLRRDVHMMDSLLRLVNDPDRVHVFNMQALGVASTVRQYSNWAKTAHREKLGNGSGEARDVSRVFESLEAFSEAVPSRLIELVANTFYRFTATSVYAVEELYRSPLAPEIRALHDQFLRGEIAYFDLQIQTMDFMRRIVRERDQSKRGLARFQHLEPIFIQIDRRAREAVARVLLANGVKFTLDTTTGPIYGLEELNVLPDLSIYTLIGLEGDDAATVGDNIELRAPFHIAPEQPEFMRRGKIQVE